MLITNSETSSHFCFSCVESLFCLPLYQRVLGRLGVFIIHFCFKVLFALRLSVIGPLYFSLLHSHPLSFFVPFDFQAVRYIELLPPEKRPVAGTEGAVYRRQQMARQLPEHDQDPSKCHELSPAEVKKMQQFVRKYKEEALGVGDVLLPEEMALVHAGGEPGTAVEVGDVSGVCGPGSGPGAPAGTAGGGAGSGFRPGTAPAGASGALSFGHIGPSGDVVGPGATGPGLGQSAEFGPTGGATGTTSTAGAMGAAGLPQQNFVSNLFHFFNLVILILDCGIQLKQNSILC